MTIKLKIILLSFAMISDQSESRWSLKKAPLPCFGSGMPISLMKHAVIMNSLNYRMRWGCFPKMMIARIVQAPFSVTLPIMIDKIDPLID